MSISTASSISSNIELNALNSGSNSEPVRQPTLPSQSSVPQSPIPRGNSSGGAVAASLRSALSQPATQRGANSANGKDVVESESDEAVDEDDDNESSQVAFHFVDNDRVNLHENEDDANELSFRVHGSADGVNAHENEDNASEPSVVTFHVHDDDDVNGPPIPPHVPQIQQPNIGLSSNLPNIPPRSQPDEVSASLKVGTFGSSGASRVSAAMAGTQYSSPPQLTAPTSGGSQSTFSSLGGTIGTDIFAVLDTFVTARAAFSDRKNKLAAQDFTSDRGNLAAYNERKAILNAYKKMESDPSSPAPSKKLTPADISFVRDFEDLQEVAKGNKTMKQMARFRDLALQPTSALYGTSVSIAHLATSTAPSALGIASSGLSLVSGPINMVVGSDEAINAAKGYKKGGQVSTGAQQINRSGGKMDTLIRDQYTQLANAKMKNAKEDGFNGVARVVNGTSGTVTAAVGVASVAVGAATMGIGAAIAGGVVGGAFAATYARKIYMGKRSEKADLREKDVAQSYINRNKGGSSANANSSAAFASVNTAFSTLRDSDDPQVQVPSRQWHGKLKDADPQNGTVPPSAKTFTGSSVNNNRYVKEYVAAGHIAKFLEAYPTPHQPIGELDDVDLQRGRQYIEDLKKVVPGEKVDELVSKARAASNFDDRMEILTKGLHDLANI